jgi:iron complex transport system substrate-binding protein
MTLVLLCLFLLSLSVPSAQAENDSSIPPRRIVSLNLCTDQILVDLVPRERIAGLSFLAADPSVSAVADRVKGIPVLRGATEEVLAADADLVVSAAFSTPATLALMRRLGKRVVVTPLASTFDDIRRAIRVLAEAVGEPARGEALIRDLDANLARFAARDGLRPTAVAVQVGSLVSSGGSLLDEAMRWVGLDNDAGRRALGRGGRLPLEALVAEPPDLIVLANDPAGFRTAAADNLRHPALTAMLAGRPHITLPLPAWLCGSPSILTAVERLATARAHLVAGGRR